MVQSSRVGAHRRSGIGARQIADALKDQLLAGVFGSDRRLPSSRALAQELGVSRTTVTAAYDQLLAEGFIEVRQGSRPRAVAAMIGSPAAPIPAQAHAAARLSAYALRVKGHEPEAKSDHAPLFADFRHGVLSATDFPVTAWKRAMNAAIDRRAASLDYGSPSGSLRLRKAIQGYLWRARTIRCDPEQIIVVAGAQQGFDLCARLLLDPGDQFVAEDPCYPTARSAFAAVGADCVAIPADASGLETRRLSDVEARLAYVTPSHQFPLGGVLPVSRRQELLRWARDRQAYVIEDDYDSEYRYDIHPVPPLHTLDDGERVIYVGTVSKTLSPGLRLGYLVVPPGLARVFAAAKDLSDRHASLNEQAALASLIEDGGYERHVRRVRRLNHERRATLLNALDYGLGDRATVEGADAGLHVVLWLNEVPRDREAALVLAARAAGVGLYGIGPLYHGSGEGVRPDRAGFVMGYASLDTRRIERGVHALAGLGL